MCTRCRERHVVRRGERLCTQCRGGESPVALADEPWRHMTVPEVTCGVCDASPSGAGAASVVHPKLGLIVACAKCLPDVRRARDRAAARARRDERR